MEEETEAQRGAVICLRSHSKDVQNWEENSDLSSGSVAGRIFKMFNSWYSRAPTNQNRDTCHSTGVGPGGPRWASGTPSGAAP